MARAFGDARGGIAGLHRLLDEHGEAVEADLSRYHGRSLAEFTTGEMTARELRVRITYLPRDSATVTAVGDEGADWSREARYLTDVVHALTGKPHPERERIVNTTTANRQTDRLLEQRRRLQGG